MTIYDDDNCDHQSDMIVLYIFNLVNYFTSLINFDKLKKLFNINYIFYIITYFL